jgi:putative ABC transport system substrate-binding protein
MRRREFIVALGGAAAWPVVARGQQRSVPVVGVLVTGAIQLQGFLAGLRDVGYLEGQNVALEIRQSEQYSRVETLAADLVNRQVAVIAALGGPAAPAARAATRTIPIVFSIGGDPVELGLVSSLQRPEGNVTGVTFFAAQLLQKQVGLLRMLLPRATTLGALVNPNNARHLADAGDVQEAARSVSLEIRIERAVAEVDLEGAFAALSRLRVDALIVLGDPFFVRSRTILTALAARHRIPAIYNAREYVEVGGLMTYGANLNDAYRQAGIYVGRILQGKKPSDLPILQPTKFELLINMRTAKALDLEPPPNLLAIADEVIE